MTTTVEEEPQSQSSTVVTTTNGTTRSRVKKQWITCATTKELVAAVQTYVTSNDIVAELGSQLRECSSAICQMTDQNVVLVDVVRRFPKDFDKDPIRTQHMRLPDAQDTFLQQHNDYLQKITFCEIASLDDWRQAFFDKNLEYNILVLDVNAIVGNDLEWSALSIVREFSAMFASCDLVIVKSEGLNMLANRLVHAQRWIQGLVNGPTDNNGNSLPIKSPKIIAAVGVQEYRQTIAQTIQAGDKVLEVGCHLGTTTELLHTIVAAADNENNGADGYAIGVDVSSRIIKGAIKRNPQVHFAVGDAWKTAHLLRIQQDYLQTYNKTSSRIGFDVIYVDVGGLSGCNGLWEAMTLLSSLQHALEPRTIVIKSLCVQRLSTVLVPFWRLQDRNQVR